MKNVSKINQVNGRLLSVAEMMHVTGGGYPGCNESADAATCKGPCSGYIENAEGGLDRFTGMCMMAGHDYSCACMRMDE